MPEITTNIEFAHKVQEKAHHHQPTSDRWTGRAGVAESVVLSIVAVATAWSGYQAAKWDALSSQQYTLASLATDAAQEKGTLAGQDRLYDIVTFNDWVAARSAGNDKLAAIICADSGPSIVPRSRPGRNLTRLTTRRRHRVLSSCRNIRMHTPKRLENLPRKPGAILPKA
jgi:hypothetical protein